MGFVPNDELDISSTEKQSFEFELLLEGSALSLVLEDDATLLDRSSLQFHWGPSQVLGQRRHPAFDITSRPAATGRGKDQPLRKFSCTNNRRQKQCVTDLLGVERD